MTEMVACTRCAQGVPTNRIRHGGRAVPVCTSCASTALAPLPPLCSSVEFSDTAQTPPMVECVCLVEFDLQLGPTIRYTAPRRLMSPQQETELAFLCFPDANQQDGDLVHDFVYAVNVGECVPARVVSGGWDTCSVGASGGAGGGATSGGRDSPRRGEYSQSSVEFFCSALFRQKRDSSVTRGAQQKAIVVLSRYAFRGLLHGVLRVLCHRLFDGGVGPLVGAVCTSPNGDGLGSDAVAAAAAASPGINPHVCDLAAEACSEMRKRWPRPVPNTTFSALPLFGRRYVLPPWTSPGYDPARPLGPWSIARVAAAADGWEAASPGHGGGSPVTPAAAAAAHAAAVAANAANAASLLLPGGLHSVTPRQRLVHTLEEALAEPEEIEAAARAAVAAERRVGGPGGNARAAALSALLERHGWGRRAAASPASTGSNNNNNNNNSSDPLDATLPGLPADGITHEKAIALAHALRLSMWRRPPSSRAPASGGAGSAGSGSGAGGSPIISPALQPGADPTGRSPQSFTDDVASASASPTSTPSPASPSTPTGGPHPPRLPPSMRRRGVPALPLAAAAPSAFTAALEADAAAADAAAATAAGGSGGDAGDADAEAADGASALGDVTDDALRFAPCPDGGAAAATRSSNGGAAGGLEAAAAAGSGDGGGAASAGSPGTGADGDAFEPSTPVSPLSMRGFRTSAKPLLAAFRHGDFLSEAAAELQNAELRRLQRECARVLDPRGGGGERRAARMAAGAAPCAPAARRTQAVDDVDLHGALFPHLSKLWKLWELAIAGESLAVFARDSAVAAGAVLAIATLIAPVPFAGLLRPYLTVSNREIDLYVAGVPAPSSIVGGTNPFFVRQCGKWPHFLTIATPNGDVQSHKTLDADSSKREKQAMKMTNQMFSDRHFLIKTDKANAEHFNRPLSPVPRSVAASSSGGGMNSSMSGSPGTLGGSLSSTAHFGRSLTNVTPPAMRGAGNGAPHVGSATAGVSEASSPTHSARSHSPDWTAFGGLHDASPFADDALLVSSAAFSGPSYSLGGSLATTPMASLAVTVTPSARRSAAIRRCMSELTTTFLAPIEVAVAAVLRREQPYFLPDAQLRALLAPRLLHDAIARQHLHGHGSGGNIGNGGAAGCAGSGAAAAAAAAFARFKTPKEALELYERFLATPSFAVWLTGRVRAHYRQFLLDAEHLEDIVLLDPNPETRHRVLSLLQWDFSCELRKPAVDVELLQKLSALCSPFPLLRRELACR